MNEYFASTSAAANASAGAPDSVFARTAVERSRRRTRAAWTWGGGLLIGSALLEATAPLGGVSGTSLGAMALAAALLLFALAGGVSGNILGGARLGTAALIALAAAALLAGPLRMLTGLRFGPTHLELWRGLDAVLLGLALVVVLQLGRSTSLPRGWRWAPAWALAAVAVAWLAGQALISFAGPLGGTSLPIGFLVESWSRFIGAAAPTFVGVLALLYARDTPRPVQ